MICCEKKYTQAVQKIKNSFMFTFENIFNNYIYILFGNLFF